MVAAQENPQRQQRSSGRQLEQKRINAVSSRCAPPQTDQSIGLSARERSPTAVRPPKRSLWATDRLPCRPSGWMFF